MREVLDQSNLANALEDLVGLFFLWWQHATQAVPWWSSKRGIQPTTSSFSSCSFSASFRQTPILTYADTANPDPLQFFISFAPIQLQPAHPKPSSTQTSETNQPFSILIFFASFPWLNEAPTHCLWAAAKSSLEEGMSHVKQKEDKKCSPYSHLCWRVFNFFPYMQSNHCNSQLHCHWFKDGIKMEMVKSFVVMD